MNGTASMLAIRPGRRRRLAEWSRRYLPAEIVGGCSALTVAWTIHAVSNSLMAAAMAGSIGEGLGYYLCIAIRDLRHYDALHRRHGSPRRLWRTGTRTARDMLIEFGPAELVDSFLARPFFMYLMPTLLQTSPRAFSWASSPLTSSSTASPSSPMSSRSNMFHCPDQRRIECKPPWSCRKPGDRRV
jgi:hypothetical protein